VHCNEIIAGIQNVDWLGFRVAIFYFILYYDRGYGYGVQRHFQQYFIYIVAASFIGVGNRST
jgi:hypothetical protein